MGWNYMADKPEVTQTSGGINIGASIEEAYENVSTGRDVVQGNIVGGINFDAPSSISKAILLAVIKLPTKL